MFTPFVDSEKLLVNFDPNLPTPRRQEGAVHRSYEGCDPQLDANIVASVWWRRRDRAQPGPINPDKNNLAPVGASPGGQGEHRHPGGYGVFYRRRRGEHPRRLRLHALQPGADAEADLTVAGLAPLGGFPGGLTPDRQTLFTGGVLNTFGRVTSANAIPVDLQSPASNSST